MLDWGWVGAHPSRCMQQGTLARHGSRDGTQCGIGAGAAAAAGGLAVCHVGAAEAGVDQGCGAEQGVAHALGVGRAPELQAG